MSEDIESRKTRDKNNMSVMNSEHVAEEVYGRQGNNHKKYKERDHFIQPL